MDQGARNAAAACGGAPRGGVAALVPELEVSDLAESLSFWVGVLGFAVAHDRPAAGFADPGRDGAQVMPCRINGEWATGPLSRPFGRGVNLQTGVARLAPILAALARANWPLFRPPEEKRRRVGEGEVRNREVLVQDPDGYLLRFAEDLGRRTG